MVVNIANALAAYSPMGGDNAATTASAGVTAGGESFGDMLKGFSQDTINDLQASETATTAAVAGKADITSVILAVSKAETALQGLVTIRDKVIAAYQDITKTAI